MDAIAVRPPYRCRVTRLPQALWTVRFLAELSRLGCHADPAVLADRGCALWEAKNMRSPENAARDMLAALLAEATQLQ